MYPKLMEASGIAYRDLLSRLIDLALERHQEKTTKTRFFQSGSQWFA
jgi:D-alanine-D-alanine ligase